MHDNSEIGVHLGNKFVSLLILNVFVFINLLPLLLFLPPHSKSDMSRLRLAAGGAIMKLAQEPCYHDIITPEQFQLCGLVINVSLTFTSFFYRHFLTRYFDRRSTGLHNKMNDG